MESYWAFIMGEVTCILSSNLHINPVCNSILQMQNQVQRVLEPLSDKTQT